MNRQMIFDLNFIYKQNNQNQTQQMLNPLINQNEGENFDLRESDMQININNVKSLNHEIQNNINLMQKQESQQMKNIQNSQTTYNYGGVDNNILMNQILVNSRNDHQIVNNIPQQNYRQIQSQVIGINIKSEASHNVNEADTILNKPNLQKKQQHLIQSQKKGINVISAKKENT